MADFIYTEDGMFFKDKPERNMGIIFEEPFVSLVITITSHDATAYAEFIYDKREEGFTDDEIIELWKMKHIL